MRQLDELVEDAEFELEFDAVDHALVGCLDVIETRVFEGEDRDVEGYDEDVDVDEVGHDLSTRLPANVAFGSQDADGLVDVQSRNEELLQEEDCDLDFLVDGVGVEVGIWVGGVGAVDEDGDGDVTDYCVGYYHYKDESKFRGGSEDEVET